MRKIPAILLAFLFLLVLAACGNAASKADPPVSAAETEAAQTDTPDAGEASSETGVWTRPGSPAITDELAALFAKAADALTGADYTPVACIGRRTLDGTDYVLICRERIVSPASSETYSIVTLHVDTEGRAGLEDIENTGVETWISSAGASVLGGWLQADPPDIPDPLSELLGTALEDLGVDYRPLALLSTQTVAGTNYCVLCEAAVYSGADPEYVFVYLYEDLDGNAQITNIAEFAGEAANTQ